jgi:hypothetical protein
MNLFFNSLSMNEIEVSIGEEIEEKFIRAK